MGQAIAVRTDFTVGEVRRFAKRAKDAAQACLLCGRQPADPHHLSFAQPRALGREVSEASHSGRTEEGGRDRGAQHLGQAAVVKTDQMAAFNIACLAPVRHGGLNPW